MARNASARRVCLIGFMGAGKTSVGRALGRRLGWPFHDLDEVIENRQGKSVAALFAEDGEPAFRRAESAALEDLLTGKNAGGNLVVALGGGGFVQPYNRSVLAKSGVITVLLEAPIDELRRRCVRDGRKRPLAGDEAQFARLFAERHTTYSLARVRVDTMNKPVEQIAGEIEHMIAATAEAEAKE
ncbi:MAG TPA: shikimate kinase [Candidatus Angelobacter sp.]|nr:shikimate kinase [Candidatus Angelobacter sp.]